ncbi:MAG TPA: hypothetical protein VLS90_01845 [Thermodesulfobacteriota bacterium]|nr:hypothetical protein [Thermodesulfobacteriota bacterium]
MAQEIFRVLDQVQREIRRLKEDISLLRSDESVRLSALLGALRRRGLEPFRLNSPRHLLFPPGFSESGKDRFYEMFNRYSFRLFLREILNRKSAFRVSEVVRFSTPATGRKYLRELLGLGLADSAGRAAFALRRPAPSLGPTLEWFVAEVLRREFACPAVHGLRCRGSRYGGDYDVVALLEGLLVYVEVKSSPPKNIEGDEVGAFFSRLGDLLPHIALFLVDTELRLKDKIVPFFETALMARGVRGPGGNGSPPDIEKIGDEIFFLPPRIYILSSKRSIRRNIGLCFRKHFTLSLAREWGTGPGEACEFRS